MWCFYITICVIGVLIIFYVKKSVPDVLFPVNLSFLSATLRNDFGEIAGDLATNSATRELLRPADSDPSAASR